MKMNLSTLIIIKLMILISCKMLDIKKMNNSFPPDYTRKGLSKTEINKNLDFNLMGRNRKIKYIKNKGKAIRSLEAACKITIKIEATMDGTNDYQYLSQTFFSGNPPTNVKCDSTDDLQSSSSISLSKGTHIIEVSYNETPTTMNSMFENCSSIISINFTNLDTSSVTTMENMFGNCYSLESLDLSNFNTLNVINMANMFSNCTSLQSLDMPPSFSTSSVTNMTYMFYHCESLKSLDLSNFDTRNVEDMLEMFSGCTSLQSLNLSNFYTPKLKVIDGMFFACDHLEILDISNFDTINVNSSAWTFSDTDDLKYINLWNYKGIDIFDFGKDYNYSNLVVCIPNYRIINKGNNTLYNNDVMNNCSTPLPVSIIITFNVKEGAGVYQYLSDSFHNRNKPTEVHIQGNNIKTYHYSNKIELKEGQNIIEVAYDYDIDDMSSMFENCSSIISINFTNLNTSSVTTMENMFSNCYSLESLDLSNLSTSSVATMENMFSNCYSLKSLDLSKLTTNNVTTMESMFRFCSSLKSLDLSNFVTLNVLNMENMFSNCTSLESLILSSFVTSNVTSMS